MIKIVDVDDQHMVVHSDGAYTRFKQGAARFEFDMDIPLRRLLRFKLPLSRMGKDEDVTTVMDGDEWFSFADIVEILAGKGCPPYNVKRVENV